MDKVEVENVCDILHMFFSSTKNKKMINLKKHWFCIVKCAKKRELYFVMFSTKKLGFLYVLLKKHGCWIGVPVSYN